MILHSFLIPIFFLLGMMSLTGLIRSIQLLGRIHLTKEFKKRPRHYFFFSLIQHLFPKRKWENLLYLFSLTKFFLCMLYTTTFFYFLLLILSPQKNLFEVTLTPIFVSLVIVVAIGLFIEFFIRFIIHWNPLFALRLSTWISTFFLLLFSPITCLLLKLHLLFTAKSIDQIKKVKQIEIKNKMLEIVHESELSALLDPIDRRLITSIASFRERIVREIMVPRINIFSLSVDQTLHEAAQKFISEGFSRIPVYQNTVDHIVGVLLYKDVMAYYFRSIDKKETSPIETPLKKLVKPILYTPETKKISKLLQEMRAKQIHLVIVVDEYGGTEGVVTIEDILEEIVGEIADEYDVLEEEKLYCPHAKGGWIVDAKMSILDLEKELGIKIEQSPEYDTLGGFVFHRAGTIPSKGWKMHLDHFDLEILESNERTIEKIILTPLADFGPSSQHSPF